MKNTNIGIANLVISNKLKQSFFSNNLIEESKKLTNDFFDVVKSSPILQLEFKVFNNIENKHIDNELVATRYIDNNIKLFEVYTINEIEAEREKLLPFISDYKYPIDGDKMQLYFAIDSLITESLNDYDKIDVDAVHEAFTLVLSHIKAPKKTLVENVDEVKPVDEHVIEIAVGKFNQKYEALNEDDKILFQTLITADDSEKQELLENYKSESLTLLEAINKDTVKENIAKAIQKIKEMVYNKANVDDDIISLHELKKDLL
jgi:hypothetical protein